MTPFDTAVKFVVAMLFSGLWQGALCALIAWIVLRAMPRANATTRHSVLAFALLAALVLPVVTAALTTVHIAAPPVQPSGVTTAPRHIVPEHPHKNAASVPVAPHATHALASAPPIEHRVQLSIPRAVAIGAVGLWLLGAAFVLLRLALSLWHLERLKRDALPLPVEYREHLAHWTDAFKGSRSVRLCHSPEIVIPIAVGLFDAMILVPERLLEELPPEDVDRIVLHELAHLRRGDDWLNAVERIAAAIFFFNPGILWLVNQLDLEREVACDDWVLQQAEALPYARCLTKVVETTAWPYRAMAAPGAFVTRRGMSIRIERLLARHRDVGIRTSFGPAGIAIAATVAIGIAAIYISPSFAYSIASPQSTIAAKTTSVSQPVKALPHVVAAVTAAPQRAVTPVTQTTATARPTVQPVPTATAPSPSPASSPIHPHEHSVTRTNFANQQHTHVEQREIAQAMTVAAAQAEAAGKIAEQYGAGAEAAGQNAKVLADNPAYIDQLAAVGYTGLTVDQLVSLRSVGVTADYIRDLASAGYAHPSVEQLIELKSIGATGDSIRGYRARYGSSLKIDDIVKLSALHVDAAYIADLQKAGYPNLTVDQTIQLRALGIDGDFIRRAATHGFRNQTIDQLMKLKATGIL